MDKNNSINYSIIIPHKNTPDLLYRCLKSIPIRKDLQIIIVDDNSEELKVNFSSFPGLDRPNTEVYLTKEGKGAGYARNFGLTKAKGKWIVFADADDYFNECFNKILDNYIEVEADLVYFQTNSVNNETLESTVSRGIYYNKWIIESLNKELVVENVRYRIHPPWGKFISHQLIKDNNIIFDEVYSSNDVMFSTKSGHYANKILLDLNYLYCSTIRHNSLEFTITAKNIEPRFYVAVQQYIFLQSISKVKYRMNVWEFIFMLKKTNAKNSLFYIKHCTKSIKLKHLVLDYFIFSIMQFLGSFKNKK